MEQENFFYELTDGYKTFDRIDALQRSSVNEIKFRLGNNIENYDYCQHLSDAFEDLIAERLLQIRKKYSYLRLWFSGGKDSKLIFDECLRTNTYPDEIVILKHRPTGTDIPIGSAIETEGNAIKFLEDIAYKKSKITIINLDPSHYHSVFRHKDWHRFGNLHNLHAPLHQGYFFKFVNEHFGYFTVGDGIIDLLGCVQPHVFWEEDRWRFSFVDLQFFNHLRCQTENFMVSDDFPEILHGYVRDLSSSLDKSAIKLSRWQTSLPHSRDGIGQQLREIRDLVPAFARIKQRRPDFEMPKNVNLSWQPSDHCFWKYQSVFKSTISCMLCYNQEPWPAFFRAYVEDSNWKEIEFSKASPGILSKVMDAQN